MRTALHHIPTGRVCMKGKTEVPFFFEFFFEKIIALWRKISVWRLFFKSGGAKDNSWRGTFRHVRCDTRIVPIRYGPYRKPDSGRILVSGRIVSKTYRIRCMYRASMAAGVVARYAYCIQHASRLLYMSVEIRWAREGRLISPDTRIIFDTRIRQHMCGTKLVGLASSP